MSAPDSGRGSPAARGPRSAPVAGRARCGGPLATAGRARPCGCVCRRRSIPAATVPTPTCAWSTNAARRPPTRSIARDARRPRRAACRSSTPASSRAATRKPCSISAAAARWTTGDARRRQLQRPTYFERVAVDASDDRAHLAPGARRRDVYRVEQDGGRGNQPDPVPAPTCSRWLRLRIADPQAPFPLSGARSRRGDRPQPVLDAAAVRRPGEQRRRDAPADLDLRGRRRSRCARRRSRSPTAAALRAPRVVESSDDGTDWSAAGDGAIARFAGGGAQTLVRVRAGDRAPLARVVENGNDPPVPGLRPPLLARRASCVFRAAPQRHVSRCSRATRTPARRSTTSARGSRTSAWPAAERRSARRRRTPPTPTRARSPSAFPWLLTALLLDARVALGALALRTVRAGRASPDNALPAGEVNRCPSTTRSGPTRSSRR